jgi:glycosyltransferase involved in cell wall biosynthesis
MPPAAPSPVLDRFSPLAVAPRRLDSVYFFMWAGWRDELESNRWHWGKRWAATLPVVFIQPELRVGELAEASPEPRLANVEILSVEANSSHPESLLRVGLRQSGQIAAHMLSRGHERPLFWFYNPWLAVPYMMLPAAARIYHATENYFDFENIPESWLALARHSIENSDLVICCSEGIVRGFANHTRRQDFITLPNGCEYPKYSKPATPLGSWPARIEDWRRANRRLAVFAGNINLRLDYGLVNLLAARHPEIGFVFSGPIGLKNLSAQQRRDYDTLLRRSNVRTLGRLPPEDLPALYWHCDVGILPYRTDMPVLVENGFPLKALEMAASGLPVVSSLMKPLQKVPEAVIVTDSPEAFDTALQSQSRRTRSPADRAGAERVCRMYDYDILFERMLGELAARIRDEPPRPGNLADFAASIGLEYYRGSLADLADAAPRPAAAPPPAARPAMSVIPQPIRRMVSASMRRLGRWWMV